ncbi:MAG: endonuclease III domain-containing protein [Thermoplasmata archaeon]|nr:endonuclease III domain-containing protein [Thermoplasmata archaeon]
MSEVMELYRLLYEHFGPRHWWPGDSPFEVIVGAILTQQASWGNVEQAIANLKDEDMLDPEKIASAGRKSIERLIRPSGFYRQKAVYLIDFCKYLVDGYDASLDKLFSKSTSEFRKELLSLRGIGPETCDSILLYAGQKLTFVVDAYTVRACGRIGLTLSSKYDEVKEFFESRVEPDVRIYNEFHALFVELGKNYCKASEPLCEKCPLSGHCEWARSKSRIQA